MNTLIFKIKNALSQDSLARDDRGLSTVEYVIILVLIAVLGIVSWNKFGGVVKDKIDSSKDAVEHMEDAKDGTSSQ
jgi:Flp pilus assembly pilin Flp